MQSRQQIDRMMQALCDMFNNCDIRCAEPYFAPDISYDSMWILSTMKGKRSVCFYLETKFNAMLSEKNRPKAAVVENQPALLIRQGEVLVALTVDMRSGLVTHLSLVEPTFFIDQKKQ